MGLFRATVDLKFAAGSGAGTNTWHMRTLSEDGTTLEVSELMSIVQAFYGICSDLLPSTSTAAWDGLVTEVGVPDPRLLEAATPWIVGGALSSAPYTAAAGMGCVTWRSALATRSGRGRTFLGPLAASTVEGNGTLTSTALTKLRSAAAATVSDSLADINGALVVWSETQQIGRDFVASSVTDQVAILKSRRD